MTRDKIYQVFVSSTYEDLKEERIEVMNALIERNCIPVGMEYFPACNLEQFEYIKRLIDEVDYYVLIVAGKYGSIEKESKKSYTQLEYEYAKSKNIPIASFVINSINDLASSKVESTLKGKNRLNNFRQLVMSDRMCKKWANKIELAKHVQNSIEELILSSPREGWVRLSSINKKLNVLKEDELNLSKVVTLHPVYNPFSIDNDNLVFQTTWGSIILTIAPVLKEPVSNNEIETRLRNSFKGISSKDIETILEQLNCFDIVDTVYKNNQPLKILSKKGWHVYGNAKGYSQTK